MIPAGDPAAAQTPPAGQLKCHVDPGLSFIVGSSRQVDCGYMPGRRRRACTLCRRINKVGVDLDWEKGGMLISGARERAWRALRQLYFVVGVSAGGNALVGGAACSFSRVTLARRGVNGRLPRPAALAVARSRRRHYSASLQSKPASAVASLAPVRPPTMPVPAKAKTRRSSSWAPRRS